MRFFYGGGDGLAYDTLAAPMVSQSRSVELQSVHIYVLIRRLKNCLLSNESIRDYGVLVTEISLFSFNFVYVCALYILFNFLSTCICN